MILLYTFLYTWSCLGNIPCKFQYNIFGGFFLFSINISHLRESSRLLTISVFLLFLLVNNITFHRLTNSLFFPFEGYWVVSTLGLLWLELLSSFRKFFVWHKLFKAISKSWTAGSYTTCLLILSETTKFLFIMVPTLEFSAMLYSNSLDMINWLAFIKTENLYQNLAPDLGSLLCHLFSIINMVLFGFSIIYYFKIFVWHSDVNIICLDPVNPYTIPPMPPIPL